MKTTAFALFALSIPATAARAQNAAPEVPTRDVEADTWIAIC